VRSKVSANEESQREDHRGDRGNSNRELTDTRPHENQKEVDVIVMSEQLKRGEDIMKKKKLQEGRRYINDT